MLKTYVFDIDNTICVTVGGDYENSKPIYDRIKCINSLYDKGNIIVINTARGMGRTSNNVQEAHNLFYSLTKAQLEGWGLKYHRLFMGKPAGDYYVDDKGVRDCEFFRD